MAAGAVIAVALTGSESRQEQYVEALEEAGLGDEYRTDRAAVIAAEAACEEFDRTGDPKGTEAIGIAVDHYCPHFAEDFEELEVAMIEGTFTIVDSGDYLFLDNGDPCEGEGGYGDISASTRVVLTNVDGDVLARTELGPGEVSGTGCRFSFELEVTEGEDQYVLEVGDRGEVTYTFEEVKRGPALTLG